MRAASLVDLALRRQIEERYGSLPRAEDFALLRHSDHLDERPLNRSPELLRSYRKRWAEKKAREEKHERDQI